MMNIKIVNDNVFGIIQLPSYITSVIDTPQFQRLRFINQLGLVQYVYPSATHTRFMHSIGVFHLASQLVTKLQQQLETEGAELQITDVEVKCVEIAALCHDIGHGPMSHFWEILCERIKENYNTFQYVNHEKLFRDVWKLIRQNEEVKKSLIEIEIGECEEKLIERLILGEPEDGDNKILFLIISNNESGMDVDKWEYLTRDSIQLGHKTSNLLIEVERMIHFARAIKDDKGKWKIAFRSKESRNIVEIYKLRAHLYETAYRHKTVLAIEQMLIAGFLNDNFPREEREQFGNCPWIMDHTDSYIYQCLNKYSENNRNFENFQKLDICEFSRILKRNLYVLEIEAIKEGEIDNINEEVRRIQNEFDINKKSYFPIIIQLKNSTNDPNPMTKIPFYGKRNLNKIFYYKDNANDHYFQLLSTLQLNLIQSKCYIFYLTKIEEHVHKQELIDFLRANQWRIQIY